MNNINFSDEFGGLISTNWYMSAKEYDHVTAVAIDDKNHIKHENYMINETGELIFPGEVAEWPTWCKEPRKNGIAEIKLLNGNINCIDIKKSKPGEPAFVFQLELEARGCVKTTGGIYIVTKSNGKTVYIKDGELLIDKEFDFGYEMYLGFAFVFTQKEGQMVLTKDGELYPFYDFVMKFKNGVGPSKERFFDIKKFKNGWTSVTVIKGRFGEPGYYHRITDVCGRFHSDQRCMLFDENGVPLFKNANINDWYNEFVFPPDNPHFSQDYILVRFLDKQQYNTTNKYNFFSIERKEFMIRGSLWPTALFWFRDDQYGGSLCLCEFGYGGKYSYDNQLHNAQLLTKSGQKFIRTSDTTGITRIDQDFKNGMIRVEKKIKDKTMPTYNFVDLSGNLLLPNRWAYGYSYDGCDEDEVKIRVKRAKNIDDRRTNYLTVKPEDWRVLDIYGNVNKIN